MYLRIPTIAKAIFAGSLLTAMISCNSNTATETTEKDANDSITNESKQASLKPAGQAPEWGTSIKPEMQVVMDKLASLGGKPIETLDAKEARKQPTPTDAVMAVMQENNIPIPPAMCDTVGRDIPVTGGTTHVRIYTPKQGAAPFPIIVYYHGGGWVIADINTN